MQSLADLFELVAQADPTVFYILAYGFLYAFIPIGPVTFFINAPFGRFSWSKSWLNINANLGWFLMEIISPIMFLRGFIQAKTLPEDQLALVTMFMNLPRPTLILISCYLIHYLNRSIIFVITQPTKRSPMHLLSMSFAIVFNLANGYLLGSWIGGRTMPQDEVHPKFIRSPMLFMSGLLLWLFGFISNVVHDQVLLNLRRKPNRQNTKSTPTKGKYYIPYGYLFDFPFGGVSNPAYLSEWIEWSGFVMSCLALGPSVQPALPQNAIDLLLPYIDLSKLWLPIPPALFLLTEITTMLPRAIKGHGWYHATFQKDYPKSRRAIIPGLL